MNFRFGVVIPHNFSKHSLYIFLIVGYFVLSVCRFVKFIFGTYKKMLLSSYFSELPRRDARSQSRRLVQHALNKLKSAIRALREKDKNEVQALRFEIRLTTAGGKQAIDTHLM